MELDVSSLQSINATLEEAAARIGSMARAQAASANARGEEVGNELNEIESLLDIAVRRLTRLTIR